MNYYINREQRLDYQKEYNALYHDEYLEYQRWYYQNVRKPNYVPKKRVKKEVIKKEVIKKTKITKGFLKELEKVCKNKIKDYNDTLYHQQEAKKITNNDIAFVGFDVINGKFRLKF
jgi:hypothetical protein